jgi:membrane protein YdbS with pleckstrin-like domain
MSEHSPVTPFDGPAASFEPDGAPVWRASEGQVVNLGTYLIGVLAFWLVVPPLWALYRFLVVRSHVYELTDQRLRESRGLLFRYTEVLELYRVRDISIEQPPRQRLFGRGRLILRTSDLSTPVVILNAIPGPLTVANLLRNQVERCRVQKGVRKID